MAGAMEVMVKITLAVGMAPVVVQAVTQATAEMRQHIFLLA
jgi:hypothetical protein